MSVLSNKALDGFGQDGIRQTAVPGSGKVHGAHEADDSVQWRCH